MIERAHIVIRGAVQGVGFRPFVYRLATEMNLCGWVLNSPQGVFIEVEGEAGVLDNFLSAWSKKNPALLRSRVLNRPAWTLFSSGVLRFVTATIRERT